MKTTLRRLASAALLLLTLQGALSLVPPSLNDEGVWTAPSLWVFRATPVEATYRPSVIKSIQRGTITLTAAQSSNTATLSTSVTTANALAVFGGFTADTAVGFTNASTQKLFIQVVLTDSTTVTASRNAAATTDSVVVPYQVIEFYRFALRQDVQRGVITLSGATSATATITSVTTAKALLVGAGWTKADATGENSGRILPNLVLTNSTTVTVATTASATAALTIPWQVAEFK
ncbi:MAG: hypothetical protein AB7O67_23225 [Vicinamibacterales bacterium]